MTILIDEKHFCEYRYSNRGNIKCQPIDFSHSKYVDIGMYVYKKKILNALLIAIYLM